MRTALTVLHEWADIATTQRVSCEKVRSPICCSNVAKIVCNHQSTHMGGTSGQSLLYYLYSDGY